MVQGLGFRVLGLLFGVQGVGFRVQIQGLGLRSRVQGLGFGVQGCAPAVGGRKLPVRASLPGCAVRRPLSAREGRGSVEREFVIDNLLVRIHLMILVDRPRAVGVGIPFSR